jgi:hypothetical protein
MVEDFIYSVWFFASGRRHQIQSFQGYTEHKYKLKDTRKAYQNGHPKTKG